ncbi:transcriptional regulator, HxlR family [Cnuella takakiae]|uniref:Transcriptional regulator, HxlR family n=1 Tax=Cnuella takakiae TaxID=1302690 RepID=A0A1M4Z4P0_9BACT|nr:helix-turn-helix domain-containing protein [Cnuella takakiae]OLY94335.1 transcriptional regulator [Cnuella takakiae]SHF12918.1 transcriptional regulator, HxlR family [Cnuella takakiae]
MNSFTEVLQEEEVNHCPKPLILALKDTMNAVKGKWKLPIIAALFHGKNRFKNLQENIEKITPRMLSKELKELEINGIVTRRVLGQSPLLIEYRLTPSGKNITKVIDAMIDWGLTHRKAEIKMTK